MNFQQYLQQDEHLPVGSVDITKDDCSMYDIEGDNVRVGLFFPGTGHVTYVTNIREDVVARILWTTDEDGNPKKRSVFNLID